MSLSKNCHCTSSNLLEELESSSCRSSSSIGVLNQIELSLEGMPEYIFSIIF